ncbi:MAG: hypothetical protein IT184_08315 [Acidobacteria bacterium]|nr:hypothetical protein [Acidobacteriota bacterium]
MRFLQPLALAFVLAVAGALATGMRPGWPFSTLLIGATLAAAMTGLVASVLQFLPERLYLPFAILAGAVVALFVSASLQAIEVMGFGSVRDTTVYVWPVAAIVTLLVSRASGMRLPSLRRRRSLSR